VSRGGAAYRPETLRHTPKKLANEDRFAERYSARCRTDRCRWAASAQHSPRTDRVWANNQGQKCRATGLRPADRPT